jgi:hypothetical protein
VNGYERLLELTRRQRTLIDAGQWQDAIALGEEWQQLADSLPEQAPAAARPLLEEASRIAWSNTAAIEALANDVAWEIEQLSRGRRALASYTAGRPGTSVDARG